MKITTPSNLSGCLTACQSSFPATRPFLPWSLSTDLAACCQCLSSDFRTLVTHKKYCLFFIETPRHSLCLAVSWVCSLGSSAILSSTLSHFKNCAQNMMPLIITMIRMAATKTDIVVCMKITSQWNVVSKSKQRIGNYKLNENEVVKRRWNNR